MRSALHRMCMVIFCGVVLVLATTPCSIVAGNESSGPVYTTSGYYAADAGLTPSQRAGREIWYKATAGNDRFHTYVFQQRIGVLIDWYRVLNTRERDDRFAAWGLINDPDCCQPGSADCPAKNDEETFGFDWCPGDEELPDDADGVMTVEDVIFGAEEALWADPPDDALLDWWKDIIDFINNSDCDDVDEPPAQMRRFRGRRLGRH